MRALLAAALLHAACAPDAPGPPQIGITFGPERGADGRIPYRANGAFTVTVTAEDAAVGRSTHALVELETSESIVGAVPSAALTLDEQGGGIVGGTATLAWPPGGAVVLDELSIDVQVAGERVSTPLPLEVLTLTPGTPTFANNGAQTTMSLCIDSSATDGTLAVRLAGGVFKDTNATDAMLPLVLGPCDPAAPPDSRSSHAKLAIVTMAASVDVLATLPNTNVSRDIAVDVTPFATVHPHFVAPPTSAPGLGIVELDVHVDSTVEPGVKGVALSFTSTPTLVFDPPTATTDSNGDATVHVQMPESGDVFVTVHAGNQTDTALVHGPPPSP